MGIIAENMARWRIPAPVWSYSAAAPDPSQYYAHHPWGIFWTTTAFYEVFGRHDYVCRLPAALLSIATPPLVYKLCKEVYRPIAGACGAVAFVGLPISLSFAAFNALEVPVIAYGTLFLWAWVRAKRSGSRRALALTTGAALLTMGSDWPGSLLVIAVLVVETIALVAARRRPNRAAMTRGLVLAAAGLIVAGFYLALFAHYGKLGDLFGSYRLRSHGTERSLFAKLDDRRHWIELMFTPIAIGIGKAAAVVVPFRIWAEKRAEEALPLCVLAMATAQYLAFPQGADIHVFWPHHFALYVSLSVAALVATVTPLLARRWGEVRGLAITLAVTLLPLVLVLRDGVETLVWARRTGGRFSEKGHFIQTDGDKIAVLRHVAAELPPDAKIALHESMGATWAQVWSGGGRVVGTPPFSETTLAPYDVWIADLRQLRHFEATTLLFQYDVHAYGPYLVGRRGQAFDAVGIRGREPTPVEWWLRSGTEPVWSFEPDPFLRWEIAFHYGLDAEPPTEEPRGLEQLRVAHNVALERGDHQEAARIESRLTEQMTHLGWAFEGDLEVVGVHLEGGVQPRATVLFRAGKPLRGGVFPKLRGRIVERAPLSTVMVDPTRRDVAPRPLIAPVLWKTGHLYSLVAPLLPRPGVESFELVFAGVGAPRPIAGRPSAELFRWPAE